MTMYSPLAIENVVVFFVVVVVAFTVKMDDRPILITVAYKCQTSMTYLECASTAWRGHKSPYFLRKAMEAPMRQTYFGSQKQN